jgi:aerobic carbon-monoxide dehydrogenase small subunit
MKRELKSPSDEDIKKYVVGNLCRCSGYEAQFKAIKRYLGEKL